MKIYTLDDILKTEHLGDEKYVRFEEIEGMRKALEFYKNSNNYDIERQYPCGEVIDDSPINKDYGDRAKKALGEK
jgi:hypothetical protein